MIAWIRFGKHLNIKLSMMALIRFLSGVMFIFVVLAKTNSLNDPVYLLEVE